MLKSSSLCLYSSNLGTFWLKIEQFWPFEEISIFSNGGHLRYRTALTDTFLKGTHQGFQSGPVPGTFTRLRSCIVLAEITEPPQISGGSKPQVRWSIGLWNIFHKKLMITSIAEFSHTNRTTASRPS